MNANYTSPRRVIHLPSATRLFIFSIIFCLKTSLGCNVGGGDNDSVIDQDADHIAPASLGLLGEIIQLFVIANRHTYRKHF